MNNENLNAEVLNPEFSKDGETAWEFGGWNETAITGWGTEEEAKDFSEIVGKPYNLTLREAYRDRDEEEESLDFAQFCDGRVDYNLADAIHEGEEDAEE